MNLLLFLTFNNGRGLSFVYITGCKKIDGKTVNANDEWV